MWDWFSLTAVEEYQLGACDLLVWAEHKMRNASQISLAPALSHFPLSSSVEDLIAPSLSPPSCQRSLSRCRSLSLLYQISVAISLTAAL